MLTGNTIDRPPFKKKRRSTAEKAKIKKSKWQGEAPFPSVIHLARPKTKDEDNDGRHRVWVYFLIIVVLLLLLFLFWGLGSRFSTRIPANQNAGVTSVHPQAYVPPMPRSEGSVNVAPKKNFSGIPNLSSAQIVHLNKVLKYLYGNINPNTYMGYSLPGDDRLQYWSVVYDDAMRIMMHVKLGDLQSAQKSMDYFLQNTAIQRHGWYIKEGRQFSKMGWIVNIIDAAEPRPGGRGIEHIAHVGPNAYLGLAAVHLYEATGKIKYLEFARGRWELLKDLQNEDQWDPNYGGIRMGPLGNPNNQWEQKLSFNEKNPSWYQLYNSEHAADFKGFSDLLAQVDSVNRERYEKASALIVHWDKKVYDKKNHLFYMGTTEVPFFDSNVGQWQDVGIINIQPLDSSSLKLSAYGVDGMDVFEPGAAEKVRDAIEKHFKVTVENKMPDGSVVSLAGYDFVPGHDRKRIILYEEIGRWGDVKIRKGVGRDALVTDEWSTWVAMADLRLATDFRKKGNKEKEQKYLDYFSDNALIEGFKGAYPAMNDSLAYPYAHPLPYSLNKPVGFGWNTHHQPYAMISGVGRVMGALRFDTFHLENEIFGIKSPLQFPSVPKYVPPRKQGLYTEAEVYLNRAWNIVKEAREDESLSKEKWVKAIKIAENMIAEHPDWVTMAKVQNDLAARSYPQYPLLGEDGVTVSDLEPIFRQYWALYHIGTCEFIRFMGYSELALQARENGDLVARETAKEKAYEAAAKIIQDYRYSQAYDDRGWLWRPINSLYEYLGFSAGTVDQLLTYLSSNNNSAVYILQPVQEAIKRTL